MPRTPHYRDYPFRPPRRVEDAKAAAFHLYLSYVRRYLLPHRWSLLLALFLVSTNACSIYLMAYYGRLVIDNILVIGPPQVVHSAPSSSPQVVWTDDRMPAAKPPPDQGIGRAIDMGRSVSPRPAGAGGRLLTLFVVYLVTLLSLNYLALIAQRIRIRIGQRITRSLREDLHNKVLALSISYHRVHTPGRLLSRITSDVEILQAHLLTSIFMSTRNVIMALVGLVILTVAEWRLTLFVMALMPLYAIVYVRSRDRVTQINRELRHTNSCLYGLVSQKLDAIKAIHAYYRVGLERLNFNRLAACFLRDALEQQRQSGRLSRSCAIISGLGTGAVFLVGVQWVLHGKMTLGEMMYVYGVVSTLFAPVLMLTELSLVFNNLRVVLQRVNEVLEEPLEIADPPNAVPFPTPLKQGFSVRNVDFRYRSAEPDTEPVLRSVSLDIPPGNWICIMGPSGSGKTTLLYMLARLYEPTAGRILVDGLPLARLQLASIRMRVGFVPQEAQIFSVTLRVYITNGLPNAEPSRIMEAAKAAELHDFIMTQPVKYETIIGEKGTTLSGGQRQRLSLARALLTDPEVLILDDCTSALDADTEQKIQNTLARILVGKTAIIVSQRVSMAMRCHRICVLEHGSITESGTHEELLKAEGFYSRLYAQQTG